MTTISPPTPTEADGAAAVTHTGSRATRLLGIVTLAVSAVALIMGLVTSRPGPPIDDIAAGDVVRGDAVRLFYAHVPVVSLMYVPVFVCALASVMWLRKRTDGWDALASSAADIATVFVGLGLVTGMIWGRITWGAYWVWDGRLTSTAMLFLLLVGYLALRRYPASPDARSRASSIVGILLVPNAIVVHFSVSWWRSLHQPATLDPLDTQIGGSQLAAYAVAQAAIALVLVWLMMHRFRMAWLERRAEHHQLDAAIAQRLADDDVHDALDVTTTTDGATNGPTT